jgi:hypothetical protein
VIDGVYVFNYNGVERDNFGVFEKHHSLAKTTRPLINTVVQRG